MLERPYRTCTATSLGGAGWDGRRGDKAMKSLRAVIYAGAESPDATEPQPGWFMKNAFVLFLLPVLLLTACCSRGPKGEVQKQAVQSGAIVPAKVIDVRTPEEYASGHVGGAVNVPVNEIEQRIAAVAPDKSTPLWVHCRSGNRSARAKATLDRLGYTNVTDLGSLAHAREVVEGK